MSPIHVPVLRANQGELDALRNLAGGTAHKILPLFEIGRLTDAIRQTKYIQNSRTPTMVHLERVLNRVGNVWSNRQALVDAFQWPADAHAESGGHVIPYMVARLRAMGVSVIPVIGYDRWGNTEYRSGLQAIPAREDGHYCLRFDSSAVEDAAEPPHFRKTILNIVDELELDPTRCSAVLDFADISPDTMSLDTLAANASDMIHQLQAFGLRHYVIMGCSLPRTINLAVSNRDSVGMVLRKEMLVWQMLRVEFPKLVIVSGDYGVRGPTTTETPSKYTNGKIRHTVKKQIFVVRGHPFTDDHLTTPLIFTPARKYRRRPGVRRAWRRTARRAAASATPASWE
jgi:hypothetical protein